jgi:hypothetical protein
MIVSRQSSRFDDLLAATQHGFPSLLPPRPRPLPRTPLLEPLRADPSKSSVNDRVFGLSLFRWPPNPNFLSQTCRGKLHTILPPRASFASRRSAMAIATRLRVM